MTTETEADRDVKKLDVYWRESKSEGNDQNGLPPVDQARIVVVDEWRNGRVNGAQKVFAVGS